MSSTASSSELLASLKKLSKSGKHQLPPEARTSDSARPGPDDSLSIERIHQLVVEKIGGVADRSSRLIDFLCMVAKADGRVDEAEQTALANVLSALLGSNLHEAVAKHLVRSSLREIAEDGTEKRMRAIADVLVAGKLEEEALSIAAAIAFASEGVSAPERGILRMFATYAGVSPERFNEIVDRIGRELSRPR